jgi:LysR family transcriptional regulator, regulator for bpeEF and oprC
MEALDDLSVFLAVADGEGFSQAARKLGITTAGASKSVLRLEQRLGVRLFTRTTRRVSLTDAGLRLHTQARPLVDSMQELLSGLADEQAGALVGNIRISLPVNYGQGVVVPILAEFAAQHPALHLDIRLTDQVVNLIEDNIDLAVRIGDLPDSSLIATQLQRASWVLCAAPNYLARYGVPKEIEDLKSHRCIGFVMPRTGRIHPWRFEQKGTVIEFTPEVALQVNDVQANRALGIAGAGMVFDLRFNVEDALRSGQLSEIWPKRMAPGPAISIVAAQGRHQPRRVRLLREFLVEKLKRATK